MPYRKVSGGYTKAGQARGGFVKNPAQYEALKNEGYSKESAARITNASKKSKGKK